MVIGIPQAFLYHRYHVQWESFFDSLGIQTVTSGHTDREKMQRGTMLAIDEACLSSKIYLGHVDSLMGKCDAIFVPRMANLGYRDILCTKFMALYDIVQNTFRSENIQLVDYNIDVTNGHREMGAYLEIGKKLGCKRTNVTLAYMLAKQADQISQTAAIHEQNRLFQRDGLKILVVGHSYNVHDAFIGEPLLQFLRSQGAVPILADIVDRKQALLRAQELTETMRWIFNKELVGAVQIYRNQVDGIILLSTFPCGPDSLVNDVLIRRVKGIPMLTLLIDNQEGTAGMETRMESFLDIIRFRKEANILG